jgi:hypothetical protein
MSDRRVGLGHIRGHLISFFVFGAWLIAADGWLKLLAPLWLVYPAWTFFRWERARRRSPSSTAQGNALWRW